MKDKDFIKKQNDYHYLDSDDSEDDFDFQKYQENKFISNALHSEKPGIGAKKGKEVLDSVEDKKSDEKSEDIKEQISSHN